MCAFFVFTSSETQHDIRAGNGLACSAHGRVWPDACVTTRLIAVIVARGGAIGGLREASYFEKGRPEARKQLLGNVDTCDMYVACVILILAVQKSDGTAPLPPPTCFLSRPAVFNRIPMICNLLGQNQGFPVGPKLTCANLTPQAAECAGVLRAPTALEPSAVVRHRTRRYPGPDINPKTLSLRKLKTKHRFRRVLGFMSLRLGSGIQFHTTELWLLTRSAT